MKIGYRTDVGKRKELDEDSIIVVRSSTVYESQVLHAALLVLADGMGGHNAGEIASQLASKRVAEEIMRIMFKKNQNTLSYEVIRVLFQESISQASREIFAYAKKHREFKGMGTTITAALVLGNNVYIGHVGDTRVYIVHEKHINQITRDHSLVQKMIEQREITKEEARTHPQKNIITRAVGVYEDVEVDTFREHIYGDDYLLICCDGLTDLVTDEEIQEVVVMCDDPQKICDVLVEKAIERGGHDNISIIVARFDELDKRNILTEKTEIISRK